MSDPNPASSTDLRRPKTSWIVGLALLAAAFVWSGRSAILHHRGETRDSQVVAILREQLDSVDSARYNTRLYVRTDNPYYKSDFDEDVDSASRNWELAQSLALDDGDMQAGVREADQELQAVCAQLDLAMEARDKNKRDKGLSMLDSEHAHQLVEAFSNSVSDMIVRSTDSLRRHKSQARYSEIACLVFFVALLAGLLNLIVRGRPTASEDP